MPKGFKQFLMRGDVIVVAVGLVVALAFSTLVLAFTNDIIDPIIARAQGGKALGLGWQLGRPGNAATFVNVGAFIAALIYFVVFMAAVYVAVVVPYRAYSARRGRSVFGEPPPTKTCPACLSDDLAPGATRCPHCTSDLPPPSPEA